jgi:N-acetylglutamate synthase-like GNAT family acetyltransferase
MDCNIKKASIKDIDDIRNCLDRNFGFVTPWYPDALDLDANHYIVARKDGQLLGISGLQFPDHTVFADGYEIAWTCVNPEYRCKGLASRLVFHALKQREDKTLPVFCACRRTKTGKTPLAAAMRKNNFTLLYPNKAHCIFPLFNACKLCATRPKHGDNCECFEDVYILRP